MREEAYEHPQGVQPWGNFLLSGRQHIRSRGTPFKMQLYNARAPSTPCSGCIELCYFFCCLTVCTPFPGLGILKDLDDQLVLHILQLLNARTLAICSAASKALYCFSMHDELWRALTLQASRPLLSQATHSAWVLAAAHTCSLYTSSCRSSFPKSTSWNN